MTRFLFWNMQRKPLHRLVAAAASEHAVDIVILAEDTLPQPEVAFILNRSRPEFTFPSLNFCERVRFFVRFPKDRFEAVEESRYWVAIHLRRPGKTPMLLVGAHLPSKQYSDTYTQLTTATRLRQDIEELERRIGHRRTILVGDVNMNPFEAGIVGGLQSRMDRRDLYPRRVRGQELYPFYNPMWSRFGDLTVGPSGTYHRAGDDMSHFWNIFDQVLVRPELATDFEARDLTILDRIGGETLTSANGRPDAKRFSDHLPILFEVD